MGLEIIARQILIVLALILMILATLVVIVWGVYILYHFYKDDFGKKNEAVNV